MNNNRGNNRRRGRGNNRNSGGGNNHNRIDSRARGNAPQLLEKYKKLAHDASLNGDRVQTEYYLQFADHYFRVLADSKAQKDESRAKRDGDREPSEEGEEGQEGDDNASRNNRMRRKPEPAQNAEAGNAGESSEENAPRPRGRRKAAAEQTTQEDSQAKPVDAAEQDDAEDKPAPKPRRTSRKKVDAVKKPAAAGEGLDPATLPPAIGISDNADNDEEAPKPRRRTRRPRAADGDSENLEVAS
ncbi:DUF4167 domain-containing protein [Altericroceibacterium endophyticum]|uniref:DUF4167 domain-containing protein n=1 Tax=Altericroceibacterium endophyticum TaxID=1808508 RepID=A0A6I4T3V6_9SPHN|nr:DUF4167 domain-containing protein [Altericroceibacterium endophyticum]MXO65448.1 DUF4167 domain-containing protein [Altericroceibacterium endophyticum]